MKNTKLLVLGMGISGCSAASFLLSRGAAVFAYDEKANFWESDRGIQALKGQGLQPYDAACPYSLKAFDALVVSPGFSQKIFCIKRL